jgi:L-glutamine-phosphate cytidylyltransferase
MKAILLAAGVGRRIGGAVEGRPKCLLALGGRTLIERLLSSLARAGVHETVIVIGYRGDLIRAAVGETCGAMRIRYAHNPDYSKGAILSLWTGREAFDEDVLIMDADVLCPDAMIERLVRSPQRNCFLLDGRVAGSGEEQMLMARDGRVYDISRQAKPGYDTVGESVGFLKVSAADAPGLLAALKQCLDAGRDRIEHEEAYPIFMRDHIVGYERVDDLPWMEIDFPEDVEQAEREILPRL